MRLYLFSAVFAICCAVSLAQNSPPVSGPAGVSGRGNPGMRRGPQGRDQLTSGSKGFRDFMAEELKHVPLLHVRTQQIAQLQQNRQALFRERQNITPKTDRPSERTLKDFHGMLSRDDEISSRIQELQSQFATDVPEMLKQIAARRGELQAEVETAKINPAQSDSDDLKNKTRAIKIYDYIESRLEALRDDPKQGDWMRRVMRGMWMMDELDSRTGEQLRRRIDDVQHEQDELRRRLTQLDSQVKELRELLNTVSPSSARQDTPKNK